MLQSSSETTASPAPISPFSSYSVPSEPTSDELPDLGAFTTVIRAWNHLQPPPRTSIPPLSRQYTPTTTAQSSQTPFSPAPSDLESDAPQGSTVWSHRLIAPYLSPHDHDNDTTTDADADTDLEHHPLLLPLPREPPALPLTLTLSPPLSPTPDDFGSGSNTEGEPDARPVEIEDISDIDDDEALPGAQPSLGYLDEALSFIAAERAKWAAQRELPSESAWRHVVEPRRKRRRKRTKAFQVLRRDTAPSATASTTADHDQDHDHDDQDADDSSSSFDHSSSTNNYPTTHKSVPATPARRTRSRKEKEKQKPPTTHTLTHSKSTPTLRISLPPDPRTTQLRTLTHKLISLFPENAPALNAVLASPASPADPRGPPPTESDPLIHVFIDHSNILIGLLTYLKRYPPPHTNTTTTTPQRKPKHLSHTALALILERGRPITRRVLVTSSPLYQPMDTAERLGYEVRVYARVPDLGEGRARRGGSNSGSAGNTNTQNDTNTANTGDGARWRGRGHSRKVSGSTSTESEQGGFPQAFVRSLGGGKVVSPGGSAATSPNTTPNANAASSNHTTTTTTRIRYREQGVDELLQLKLHQALAATDTPPPNATIVLATGDGNVGQFNEDGFLGPVRTALRKGWRVELYAWEEGLSRAWRREFGGGEGEDGGGGQGWGGRFRIVGMEQFGGELAEVY